MQVGQLASPGDAAISVVVESLTDDDPLLSAWSSSGERLAVHDGELTVGERRR